MKVLLVAIGDFGRKGPLYSPRLESRRHRRTGVLYEAWQLLLEQVKEADAARASNLGQALGPAIAARFEDLTRRRYETVQFDAPWATSVP